jgi:hypothetical protein
MCKGKCRTTCETPEVKDAKRKKFQSVIHEHALGYAPKKTTMQMQVVVQACPDFGEANWGHTKSLEKKNVLGLLHAPHFA